MMLRIEIDDWLDVHCPAGTLAHLSLRPTTSLDQRPRESLSIR
jgi:hypothetical protein